MTADRPDRFFPATLLGDFLHVPGRFPEETMFNMMDRRNPWRRSTALAIPPPRTQPKRMRRSDPHVSRSRFY